MVHVQSIPSSVHGGQQYDRLHEVIIEKMKVDNLNATEVLVQPPTKLILEQ